MKDTVYPNSAPGEMVSARLPSEMVEQIDEIARSQHNSRSGILRQALDVFFQSWGRKIPAPQPAPRRRKKA
jgi:Arc/MetJ-type ribon-helix-helix transcriptional regulator